MRGARDVVRSWRDPDTAQSTNGISLAIDGRLKVAGVVLEENKYDMSNGVAKRLIYHRKQRPRGKLENKINTNTIG